MKFWSRIFLAIFVFQLFPAIETQAKGYFPPPAAPTGLWVKVESDAVTAYWGAVGIVGTAILTVDGTLEFKGPETEGKLTGSTSLDLSQPHHFALVIDGLGGVSEPSEYDYVPQVTSKVPYEFTNTTSSAPAVLGYITINLDNSPTKQHYVSATVAAGLTLSGTATVEAADSFLIYSKGFVTNGAGQDCDAPLTVQAVDHRWPQGKTLVSTFHDADNPSKFGCALSLR